MKVALLRAELRIPGALSLKAKRSPMKSLQERLRRRHGCAVAEVDHQDLQSRGALGVAIVAADGAHLQERLQAVVTCLETDPELQLVSLSRSLHDGPDETDWLEHLRAGL